MIDGATKRTSLYLPHRNEGRERGDGKMLFAANAAEVIKLIHEVAGVVAVAIDKLVPYGDSPSVSAADSDTPFVTAFRARWNNGTREFEPAELLLINPVGIDLKEMDK